MRSAAVGLGPEMLNSLGARLTTEGSFDEA